MLPVRLASTILFVIAALPLFGTAQQPQFTPIVELVPPGYGGRDVSAMGDVNGDGTPDCSLIFQTGVGVVDLRMVACASGGVIWAVPGNWHSSADAGDTDGDGKRDVVVGESGTGSGGQILVLSGAAGATLVSRQAGVGEYNFGQKVAGAGDVNGDNYTDVLVKYLNSGGYEAVMVVAGGPPGYALAGTVLQTFAESPTPPTFFGDMIGTLGDLNGDGRSEFYISAQNSSGCLSFAQNARFLIVDGATLTAIAREFAPCTNNGGWPIAASASRLHDLTGDGVAEFAVGTGTLAGPGVIGVFSGASLLGPIGLVAPIFTTTSSGQFARSIASIGDLNGDGVSDFCALLQDGSVMPGSTVVLNGASGAVLHTIPNMTHTSGNVAGPGDANGDGTSDIISPNVNGMGGGAPRVYSGAATSYAAAFQSVLGLGCNPLGGAAPTLTLSGSTLGTTGTLTITWPAPFTQGALFTSIVGAGPTSIGSGCNVYLDLFTLAQSGPVVYQTPGAPYPINVYLPLTWTLAGAAVAVQAVALTGTGSFALTNGLAAVVGF